MPSEIPGNLGITNVGWGVCGFTSTFYAMWELNPGARGALINAPKPFNVLAEIKQYLRTLQAEGNVKTLTAITDFTRSFGNPYDKFDIDNYISRINKAVSLSEGAIKGDKNFGIAMPPKCVADYIRRIWNFDCDIAMGDGGGDAIVGVKNTKNSAMTEYRGLCHWMYRCNNQYYSWGLRLPPNDRRLENYQIVWTLTLSGRR